MIKRGSLGVALAVLLAVSPAAAQAQPVTAEQALDTYRRTFQSPRLLDCPKIEGSDEIVVCAKPKGAPDPDRLPLPVAREPGARIRGEALADGGGCMRLCHQPLKIDLMKIPGFIAKVVDRIKED